MGKPRLDLQSWLLTISFHYVTGINFYTMSIIFNQTTNSLLSHGWMLITGIQNLPGVLVSQSMCLGLHQGHSLGEWRALAVSRQCGPAGSCLVYLVHNTDTEKPTLPHWFEPRAVERETRCSAHSSMKRRHTKRGNTARKELRLLD